MASFLLLLHRSTGRGPLSTNDVTAITREYMEWADRMRAQGRLKGADRLTNDAGKILKGENGRAALSDGPYAESKEIVGGYFMIAADNYGEACRIAETCPHLKYGSHIEVRQVMEL